MDKAGHTCKESLQVYKQANILKHFIIPVVPAHELFAVPIDCDFQSSVYICFGQSLQPNNVENHCFSSELHVIEHCISTHFIEPLLRCGCSNLTCLYKLPRCWYNFPHSEQDLL